MRLQRVPGSLQSIGMSTIAVDVETKAMLHQLAAKEGKPLNRWLQDLVKNEHTDSKIDNSGKIRSFFNSIKTEMTKKDAHSPATASFSAQMMEVAQVLYRRVFRDVVVLMLYMPYASFINAEKGKKAIDEQIVNLDALEDNFIKGMRAEIKTVREKLARGESIDLGDTIEGV